MGLARFFACKLLKRGPGGIRTRDLRFRKPVPQNPLGLGLSRIASPDEILLPLSPQESNNLFQDPQFEKHPRLLNCAYVCAYVRRRRASGIDTPGIVPFPQSHQRAERMNRKRLKAGML